MSTPEVLGRAAPSLAHSFKLGNVQRITKVQKKAKETNENLRS